MADLQHLIIFHTDRLLECSEHCRKYHKDDDQSYRFWLDQAAKHATALEGLRIIAINKNYGV